MHLVIQHTILARLWYNFSTRWPQNNQVKFDTREYFQRYVYQNVPQSVIFHPDERSELSLWGLFLSFRLRTQRLVPNVTLLWQSFFNTLQNIPHIFFGYNNPLIYVLEHYHYTTKHIDVLMSGTTIDEYILYPSMIVVVVCPQFQHPDKHTATPLSYCIIDQIGGRQRVIMQCLKCRCVIHV